MADDAASQKPLSFWKMVIMYPGLFIALGSGIPFVLTAIEAWHLGVPWTRVQIAKEQQALWEKNLSCLAHKPVYEILLPEGVEVGVTLCSSGDALLRYELHAGGGTSYTWVRYPGHGEAPAMVHDPHTILEPLSTHVYYATACIFLHGPMAIWARHDWQWGTEEPEPQCLTEYIATASAKVVGIRTTACAQTCGAPVEGALHE